MPEIRERIQFSTDMMQPFSAEMRVSRGDARQSFFYTFRFKSEDYLEAETQIASRIIDDWMVPIWSERTRGVSVVPPDSVIACDTSADYRAGGYAVLWKGRTQFALLQVQSVGAGAITLTAPVGGTFTDATLMPVMSAFAINGVKTRAIHRGATELTVEFMRRDAGDLAGLVYDEYLGLDVLECAGAILTPLAGSLSQAVQVIDNGFGPYGIETLRGSLERVFRVSIADGSLAAHWTRKRWLYNVRGMDAPFWARGWGGRMTLTQPIGPADTLIQIKPLLVSPSDYVGRHVAISEGGVTDYREITAAGTAGADHTLTISALGRSVTRAGRVGIMRKVRLAADRVEFNHSHGLASTSVFAVQEVTE